MTDSATDTPDPSKSKAKLGTLRALWPFVRQHAGLFAAWLCALALASAATLRSYLVCMLRNHCGSTPK